MRKSFHRIKNNVQTVMEDMFMEALNSGAPSNISVAIGRYGVQLVWTVSINDGGDNLFPTPPEPEPGPPVAMPDPDAFYSRVREIFGGSFNDSQFAGMETLWQQLAMLQAPISYAAYVFATVKWETGSKMVPSWESLNYSVEGLKNTFSRERISAEECENYGRNDAIGQVANQQAIGNCVYGREWGLENLGNTEPTDGYDKRGCGLVQCTGRANDEKLDAAMGTDNLLQKDHGQLLNPTISSAAAFLGMRDGIFTGVALNETLPGSCELATKAQFVNSRPIINGTDHDDDIADLAMAFQEAFVAGGWPY